MQNVDMTLSENNILIIKVDLSKRLGPSKSGKTILVSTTSGGVPVPGADNITLSLNVYTKEN